MTPRDAYCSFCRKSYREVGPLVEGPGEVYICAECVELCQSIIVQEKRRRRDFQNPGSALPPPEVLQTKLHSFIPSQATDLKALTVAVHSHYLNCQAEGRRKDDQNVLLLVGSSRSSAILLTRVLAHVLDMPFACGRAESITLYGNPAEWEKPVAFKLLEASDFDTEVAQHGIVLLDGMDSREAQEMLLNATEKRGDKEPLHAPHLDIDSVLFVCLGAFTGLDEQMVHRGRHPEQPIANDDLLAFGVLAEFVHRLRAIVRVTPLDEETMVRLAVSADLQRFVKEPGLF